MKESTKFKAGRFLVPVTLTYEGKRIFVEFPFNRRLIAEIKAMQGSKWHGYDEKPRKIWSIADSPRNHFQIAYLKGENPYARYDAPISKNIYDRPLYENQKAAVDFMLARQYCELAADCGLGKTLAAIETSERVRPCLAWYIAPKSAIRAVQYDMRKWACETDFDFFTYPGLVKAMDAWTQTTPVPQFVVFDEASRLKNPSTQRSRAAVILAEYVRDEWNVDGYVLLMSGTPAPRSPIDWHNQTEVVCPGFLKEGTQVKLKQTLAITEKQENMYGQNYYQLITWRDDERKCNVCGEFADHESHTLNTLHNLGDEDDWHKFEPSINEVARLNKRLDGLVLIQLKEDCLDLPDKIFRKIELEPTPELLQVARVLIDSAPTTISALTTLRTLSDGFQYNKVQDGFETCPVCFGNKRAANPLYKVDPENQDKTTICDGCGGEGHRKKYRRETVEIPCPKEAAFRDLLDEYADVGRVVVYGGFQGSIDRIIKICDACKWDWIRADGRGWSSNLDGDPLINFQDRIIDIPRLAFVGQPGAAGMGLTLTASPVIIYYSNDFNAESRMQSEERTHRPGMDLNRGCTIIDLLHLPPDYLVLENLKKKRNLQALTLGQVKKSFDDTTGSTTMVN